MEQTQNSLKDFFKFQNFPYPDKALPFDWVQSKDFVPLLKELITESQERIQQIKASSQPPTFRSVLVALDDATTKVDLLSGLFANLEVANGDDAFHEVGKEFYPLLSNFHSDLSLDLVLFQKVKMIYEQRTKLQLTTEEQTILEKTYKGFVRNGALLSDDKKDQLRKIDQRLSVLSPQFSENVLKSTNAFQMFLSQEEAVGLPESALEAAKASAEAKGHAGKYLFTLQAPSFMAFIKYADHRQHRETIWRAFNSRCLSGDFNNEPLIQEILTLKKERAQLLGFENHAAYVLEERMAQDQKTVMQFLERLIEPSRKAALKDYQELENFAQRLSPGIQLKPWDIPYYSEKLKEAEFSFNEEELRPYFQLEKVIDGVFLHAKKLYGLEFKESAKYPVYHPEVKAYEIYNEKSEYMGLFYTDFFPRETKKSGAWMTNYREQGEFLGKTHRPHVSIVCNFTKPTPTKPSLLTYDEVRTLFHEFGHALHSILSQCQYRNVAGTSVYWDFVELPSQIMENWATEKEGLDLFAKHYRTGETIPHDLFLKIKKANLFQAGTFSLRQLQFALLDMKIHVEDPQRVGGLEEYEDRTLAPLRILPREKGTCVLTSFSHIFAGGYSAGYYSYKWAEVLDADAFEYFKSKGIFSSEVSRKFKDSILSRGGSEHPMKLYKEFRGREPDPDALLRRDGLL
jgi:peptidyl-dipeptidase Dcp